MKKITEILIICASTLSISAYTFQSYIEHQSVKNLFFFGSISLAFVLLYLALRISFKSLTTWLDICVGAAINSLYDELFGNPKIQSINEYISFGFVIAVALSLWYDRRRKTKQDSFLA
jgi:hypothetical protein